MPEVPIIYDALARHERKRRIPPYPVHKNLLLDDEMDLIEWVCSKVSFRPSDKVLDAGCGNGHTLIYLAVNHGITGLGISLSPEEIAMATEQVLKKDLRKHLKFEEIHFDRVSGKFNRIIAIESLRHSVDIEKSIQHLATKLTTGGHLVIAEDYVLGNSQDVVKHRRYWSSPSFETEKIFIDVLGKAGLSKLKLFDMTEQVPVRSGWKLIFLTAMMKLIEAAGIIKLSPNLQTYFGALLLEKMYFSGKAAYKVIIATKQ